MKTEKKKKIFQDVLFKISVASKEKCLVKNYIFEYKKSLVLTEFNNKLKHNTNILIYNFYFLPISNVCIYFM